MKIMKKILIIVLLLSMVYVFHYQVIAVEETNVSQSDLMNINYSYNEDTNTVIATVSSQNKLKPTKANWQLSENQHTYSYEFYENTNYQTIFEDVLGNKVTIQISIDQIINRKLTLNVEYQLTENNSVIAIVKANNRLKPTKTNWMLDENCLRYSYEFVNNTQYETSFEDIFGNQAKIEINVNQIDERPLELTAEYTMTEQNSMIVKVKSNNKLKDTKTNWSLQEEDMVYEYEFKNNTTYETEFTDVFDNKEKIRIEIKGLDNEGPVLDVQYAYDFDANSVTATVTSNEELKDTKTNWTLSEDKLVYEYVFKDNTNYSTSFQDKWGNSTSVNIQVTQIDKEAPKISIQYIHNDDNTVTVNMISNEPLGATKQNWELIGGGYIYTHTFNEDTDYYTEVQDLHGNVDRNYIKFKRRIDLYLDVFNVRVKYMYTSYETVKVELVSDSKLSHTKTNWTLSADGYRYTHEFAQYENYSTQLTDVHGNRVTIPIKVDYIKKIIKCVEGTYGVSGLKNIGDSRGRNLTYYKIGDGPNVFFGTFSVHGWEDLYRHDGEALTTIADAFKNKLIEMQDLELDAKWTIYLFPSVNPDGEYFGWTHNGPGRTTLTSLAPGNQGIDLNRCWQIGSSYTRYTDARNYNGTAGFQTTEARALRDFLISHKSQGGQTVLVDLHGWLNETIGDNELGSYYRAQYGMSTHIPSYGTGYLINWARSTLGARSVLVELPEYNANSTSYINATLNMLRSI